jgi:hypothetical protein
MGGRRHSSLRHSAAPSYNWFSEQEAQRDGHGHSAIEHGRAGSPMNMVGCRAGRCTFAFRVVGVLFAGAAILWG